MYTQTQLIKCIVLRN